MTDLIFNLAVIFLLSSGFLTSVLSYGASLAYWQNKYPHARRKLGDFVFALMAAIPIVGWLVTLIWLASEDKYWGLKFIPEGPVDRWEGVWYD